MTGGESVNENRKKRKGIKGWDLHSWIINIIGSSRGQGETGSWIIQLDIHSHRQK